MKKVLVLIFIVVMLLCGCSASAGSQDDGSQSANNGQGISGFFSNIIDSIGDALRIVKNLVREFNPWIFTDGTLFTLGLDRADMFVLFLSLMVLLVMSILKYNKVNIRPNFKISISCYFCRSTMEISRLLVKNQSYSIL